MHVAYTEALQMMILWLQMHVHQSTSHNISGSVSRPPPFKQNQYDIMSRACLLPCFCIYQSHTSMGIYYGPSLAADPRVS